MKGLARSKLRSRKGRGELGTSEMLVEVLEIDSRVDELDDISGAVDDERIAGGVVEAAEPGRVSVYDR
jgi:hypothetical protein